MGEGGGKAIAAALEKNSTAILKQNKIRVELKNR